MKSLNRREFLAASAMATAAASPSNLLSATQMEDGWFDRPMRWAQLTLVEDDPGKFDPGFWLDYFQRIHADAACLSAGGCVAYYPTRIPLHHRSAWLADMDPFGELVAGCRAMNMNVIARTDSHAIHNDVQEAHPDWVAVDSQGQKRRHWSSPEMWVTCALGPYNFEFMTKVHREIMDLYQVDGIFTNRWSGSGMCYCEHCRSNFRAASGMELPTVSDPGNPARRSYILWRQDRLFELWRLWDSEIRKINPEARYIANAGGGALSSLDMKTIGELASTLFADRQGRSGLMPPWFNGKNGKEYRATLGRKPIGGIFSVGTVGRHRWMDSVQSEEEIRIWVAEGIANGLRPWFTKFSGTLHDRRWLPIVERIYKWHHRHERYLRHEVPLANVAMVYSQQTATFYGGSQARAKVEDHTLGLYQALIESRVPFEMVHDHLLASEQIDRYKLLILPNIAALSERQCDQLRRFVKKGGSLLATYETSLYDEWGEKRQDFGLADLFGVSFRGRTEGPMKNSYLNLEHTPANRHPFLDGLEEADRMINGVWRLEVQPTSTETHERPPLTLVPAYPDLPMEKVYPREPRTETAGVYLRKLGNSRIVYFPWDIDRSYWEVMSVDHGKILANAVKWATNAPKPVEVTGPGVLDVTIWQQKSSLTVHLVNLTNPAMMKGPFKSFIPVGEQQVTIQLPDGRMPTAVKLLVNGSSPNTELSESRISLNVPPILDHEVIALDF